MEISREFRKLSVLAGFLGFLVWLMVPATNWDVMVSNLLLVFPFVCVPAITVLLIGWAVKRLQNRN